MNEHNTEIYNQFRTVPEDAKKKISGGRLSTLTDINPMWRIEVLTEAFGPCGTGWKYTITNMRTLEGANGEVAAFVEIELVYRIGGEWSEPIPGTGGSMFIAQEKNGLRTSDECFKMALTDALSVAAKALGVGADVYRGKDSTKYTGANTEHKPARSDRSVPNTSGRVTVKQVPPYVMDLANMAQQIWPKDTAKQFLQATGFPHPRNVPADQADAIKAKLQSMLAGQSQ